MKTKKTKEPKIQICKECKHEYDLNETKRVFTENVALSGCCSAYCYTKDVLANVLNIGYKVVIENSVIGKIININKNGTYDVETERGLVDTFERDQLKRYIPRDGVII